MGRRFEYYVLGSHVALGSLFVGGIISSLTNTQPLNSKSEAEMIFHPSRLTKCDVPDDTTLQLKDTNSASASLFSGQFWSNFCGKIGFDSSRTQMQNHGVKKIQKIQVDADDADYLNAIDSSPELRRRLQRCIGSPLYIITGLAICSSNSIEIYEGSSSTVQATIGVEAEPVSIGAGFQSSKGFSVFQKMKEVTPAILAIRVTRVTYTRKYLLAGPRELTCDEYTRGAEMTGEHEQSAEKGQFNVTVGGELVGGKIVGGYLGTSDLVEGKAEGGSDGDESEDDAEPIWIFPDEYCN